IWLGVMIAMNLQTSFLTPPFGFTLFYMRGIAPPSVSTAEIWAGAVPFVFLQILGLSLLWAFPQAATWLPDKLFGQPQIEQTAPAGNSSRGIGEFIQDGLKFDEEGIPLDDNPFSTNR